MPKIIDNIDLDDFELSPDFELKTNRNYVDNSELFESLVEYKAALLKDENASIPPTAAKAILAICKNLSYSPKFINYTYKEEMIGDAIEVCVRYISNFDPEKSRNPFAYITTIAYQAFVRRIKKEHRQHYYKLKTIQINNGFAAHEEEDDTSHHPIHETEMYIDTASQVSEYERKHREKYEESKAEADESVTTSSKKSNLESYL